MKKNKIIFWIGAFLIADGLLSLILGNSCLNSCVNNSLFGNLIRIIRIIIGGYLVSR